jgi:hypothetical protein
VNPDPHRWHLTHILSRNFQGDACALFIENEGTYKPGFYRKPRALGVYECFYVVFRSFSLSFDRFQRFVSKSDSPKTSYHQEAIKCPQYPIGPISSYRHGGKFADSYGLICIFGAWGITGILLLRGWNRLDRGYKLRGYSLIIAGILLDALACASGAIGCLPWDWWRCLHDCQEHSQNEYFHSPNIVTQDLTKKDLTNRNYCNTLIVIRRMNLMANVLDKDKQVTIIGALAEGSSIRSIERMTGVHRDTVMRLTRLTYAFSKKL